MRNLLFAAAILFVAGCQSSIAPPASNYRVDSEISPGTNANTFVIVTHVFRDGVNGETQLSTPTITLLEGQQAVASVVGNQSVTVRATVARVDGNEEGSVQVAVATKGGPAVFTSEQKLLVPLPRG